MQAQEICTNGVDDDNDGLIDLWDGDCVCYSEEQVDFFEDFEDNICCPQTFSSGGSPPGIECLSGMSPATEGTPDYFHTCGYMGGAAAPYSPFVPLPMPSGDGVGGIVVTSFYVEYLGVCLPQPLVPGSQYEASLYVGFNNNTLFSSTSPITINIYGTSGCGNYPSNQPNCLSLDPNWILLGSMTAIGNIGEWVQVSTSFTAGSQIGAIAIGASCNTVSGPHYYFFDDFHLLGEELEEPTLEAMVEGSGDCISGITLTSNTYLQSTYQWFLNGIAIPGATSYNYNVPAGAEGNYQVMIIRDDECDVSEIYEVAIDEEVLSIDADITDIKCYNEATGTIDLNLPTTNQPFNIMWSTGESTATISELAAGVYMATVTDAKGCYTVQSYEMVNPPELDIVLDYVIQPAPPTMTGEAAVLIFGGKPGYDLEWSNGRDGYKEKGLVAGHYSITVTDKNGCIDTLGFDLLAPFQSQANINPSSCADCNGSIQIGTLGGAEPVVVTITNLVTGEKTQGNFAMNMCPNLYQYSISDNNGFTILDTVDLGAQAFPKIKTDLLQDTVCVGESTGVIGVSVTGGNPAYRYRWSTGDTIKMVQKLKAGNYALTVTDQLGCTDTVLYQIHPAPLMTTEISSSPAGCLAGGSAVQDVMGGTQPYKWLWNTGDTTSMVNNIAAGHYTVLVTDSLGCRKQDTVTVIQQGGIQTSFETSNAHCEQVADGFINLYPISFNGSVTYEWSNGSTEQDIDSLAAGVYSVTMTDEIGCRLVQEYTIDLAAPYEVSATITGNKCYNDSLASIVLNVAGDSNYQYSWSEGSTTGAIEELKAGDYNVTVTDTYGCEQSYSYFITDPPLLELEVDITPLNCAGKKDGELSLTATGGTGMHTYILNGTETGSQISGLDAGVFSLMVRDENGCTETSAVLISALSNTSITSQTTEAPCGESVGSEIDITVGGGIAPYEYKWSNGNTTEDLRDVPPGIYEVTVTDKLGCEIADTIQLTNTNGPVVMVSGSDVACNGDNSGQLMISAQQGSPPYSIYLNGVLVTGSEIKDLSAGIYEVAVVDAKGCEIKTSYEITEPPAIAGVIINIVQPDINKITGSASIDVSGGTGPYTIEWDNGEKGENALTLSPGVHKVTITDSRGCTAEAEVIIVKSAIYAIWDKQDNGCAGDCEGEITITIQNEDGSEKIEWSDGGTGLIRTGLCEGDYQWTITDDYGNTATSQIVTISTPLPIKLEVEIKGESCENKADGKATISINGGTPNYTIKWDGVTGTETANLGTGAHLIEITDANGCLTDTLVHMPGVISANLSVDVKDAICETGGELTIQTSASEIIDVLINGIKYSIDKELTIRPLTPTIYKIEQQISDSCIVYKEEVTIERETFITGGNIQTEIEVKEGEELTLDLTGMMIAGSYTIEWEGVQQNNCKETDALGNCLKYVYVPDGPHEVSAYILSD